MQLKLAEYKDGSEIFSVICDKCSRTNEMKMKYSDIDKALEELKEQIVKLPQVIDYANCTIAQENYDDLKYYARNLVNALEAERTNIKIQAKPLDDIKIQAAREEPKSIRKEKIIMGSDIGKEGGDKNIYMTCKGDEILYWGESHSEAHRAANYTAFSEARSFTKEEVKNILNLPKQKSLLVEVLSTNSGVFNDIWTKTMGKEISSNELYVVKDLNDNLHICKYRRCKFPFGFGFDMNYASGGGDFTDLSEVRELEEYKEYCTLNDFVNQHISLLERVERLEKIINN